jgi:glucokinase
MYLAGDIGGTKTVLALFEPAGDGLNLVMDAVYPSQAFATFDAILAGFLGTAGAAGSSIRAGCLGVAGAIVDGRARTTNLPWMLDERVLSTTIGGGRIRLLNDLEAAAFGMLFLKPDELEVLQPNGTVTTAQRGNVGVIAAGTGLGEAILYWDGRHHHPIASEGGHGDFGPHTDLEIDLLRSLRDRFGGHVSYERVLSGPGIHNIYQFLRDRGDHPEPSWLAERLRTGDPNATIAELALAGDEPLCVAAVDLFCRIYGAEAGNLALRCVAIGGVYVGGGIAPKLLPILRKGDFLKGFNEKGRFTEFLRKIEVKVALNPRAPLLGAAHYATRLGPVE